MAKSVKPRADEVFNHLGSVKSPGAQIIKAINSVINSALEGEDLQDLISKVRLLL